MFDGLGLAFADVCFLNVFLDVFLDVFLTVWIPDAHPA
jgi:hypothetical protein